MIERGEEEESRGAGLEPGCGTNELDTVTEVTEGALEVDGGVNGRKGDEGEGDGVDMVMVVVVTGNGMERGRREMRGMNLNCGCRCSSRLVQWKVEKD